MIVKEEFLKKLKAAFDLNVYEVKIWTALLSRGMATAGELSDVSQVPRSRSYDVLESLEKKGFVIMKLGRPIKYMAIKPQEIVNRMKNHIKERTDSKIVFLEGIKKDDIFGELELLYKQGIKKVDPYSFSGSMKGRDSVYSHLRGLLENAKKSVVIVTSEQGIMRKARRFKNLFTKLKERGVKIMAAAPISSLEGPLKEFKTKAQIRSIDNLDARFCIIDGEQVLFMVSDDENVHESYDTGIWINSPYFSNAFYSMFKTTWNDLKPVK